MFFPVATKWNTTAIRRFVYLDFGSRKASPRDSTKMKVEHTGFYSRVQEKFLTSLTCFQTLHPRYAWVIITVFVSLWIRSPFLFSRVLFMSGFNVLLKHSYTLHVPFFAYSFFGSFSLTYNGNNNNNNNNNNNLIYRCFSTEPIALYNSEWSRKVSNIRILKKRNNEWFLQFKEISKKVRLKSGFKRFCWLAKFYT